MMWYITGRVPLLYVFLSGVGFSLQALIIKILAESGFHGSFQCIFFRGTAQLLLSASFIYHDADRRAGRAPKLFGDTNPVKLALLLRSLTGFGSIAFSFLAVELIPVGDVAVLKMFSPMLAAMMGTVFLAEPWRAPEFCASAISLVGIVLVAKPPFLFEANNMESSAFHKGVVYALISAVCASLAYLLVRILGTTAKMPWSNVCFSQAIGQMVLSIPCLYIFGQKLRFDLTAFQYNMLVLGGSIGAVSQILMTMGMQREKSAAASAMRMSDVVFGYLWQVLFTADALDALALGGAVLVSAGIFVVAAFKEQTPPPPQNSHTSAAEVEMGQTRALLKSDGDGDCDEGNDVGEKKSMIPSYTHDGADADSPRRETGLIAQHA